MVDKRDVMKLSFFALFFAVVFVTLSFASAEIMIGQPNSMYNAGDRIALNVTVAPLAESDGFLSMSLKCDSGSVELYKNYLSLKAGESKNEILNIGLDRDLIGDLDGKCSFLVKYGDEDQVSQPFIVSNGINVYLEVSSMLVSPGESVKVSGTAKKANGESVNGFVEVSVVGENLSTSAAVTNGAYSLNFVFPSEVAAGAYTLRADVYEKDRDNVIINEGSSSGIVNVRQVVQEGAIAFSSKSVKPGQDLTLSVVLYDQSNKSAKDDVALSVYTPSDSVALKKLVSGGSAEVIKISSNQSPGTWKVEARLGEIVIRDTFNVEEYESASFNMAGDSLIITNDGNVPYKKEVEITVANRKEILSLNLAVGESKSFILTAEDGDYPIIVNEGDGAKSVGNAHLSSSKGGFLSGITGNAISFYDSSNPLVGSSFMWVWVILIVILLVVAYLYYRKVKKDNYFGKVPKSGLIKVAPEKIKTMDSSESVSSDSSDYVRPTRSMRVNDGSNVISEGQREQSMIISLKIKNMNEVNEPSSNARTTIQRALSGARDNSAKVYSDGDYRIIVISPILTGQKDNVLASINIANGIKQVLDDHNSKYASKIEYGIGVNMGDLIVESGPNGEGFKFSSIGTSVTGAKKMSEYSNSELLIAESAQRRVLGSVKTERMPNKEYYKVNRVIERGQHNKFINQFMKRHGEFSDKSSKR